MTETRMPDLFNVDSKGKLRIRKSRVYVRGNVAYWEVQTGIEGGKLLTQEQVYNPGDGKQKRTHVEQAVFEQAAKHELKQRKEKYVTDRDLACKGGETEYPPPMLADNWNPQKYHPPYYMQPKMDGNRCLARVDADGNIRMWSRSGNFFSGLGHIERELVRIAGNVGKEGITFDGELFTWEMPFKDLNGALKRESDHGDGPKKLVQFWWYDMLKGDMPWTRRLEVMEWIRDAYNIKTGSFKTTIRQGAVVVVPSILVATQEYADTTHAAFIEQGFEGSIIRLNDGLYEADKRSHSLLKRKDFKDSEFLVIDVVEADGAPGQGVFVCRTTGGDFRVALKGSHEERAQLLKDRKKYLSKMLTVCYFETFENGIPRFPVGLRIRDEV